MSIKNHYELIPKEYLNNPYYNPNACKGVPSHPFRMIIAGASGAGKTNSVIDLLINCNNFEKVYIYAKQLDQPLYRYLIDLLTKIETKLKKKIITYSEDINDIPAPKDFDKTKQNLIIIDDMIMENSKSLKKVEELYVKVRHNNASVAFLAQSYYAIPKMIRMNSGYVLIRGIDNKRDFKLIASNFSLDKTPDELYQLYKKATHDPMQVFMVDLITTDPKQRFRQSYKSLEDKSATQALNEMFK